MSAKTIGEIRVTTDFNPAQSDAVSQIKQKTAELINLVNSIEKSPSEPGANEYGRLKSLAMTAYEEAAMWAVKAATA
jgi:hypothetical protein